MRVFIVQSRFDATTLDFNITGVFNTKKEADSYIKTSKAYDKLCEANIEFEYKISSHIVG